MTTAAAPQSSTRQPVSPVERAEQALDHWDRILAWQTQKAIEAAVRQLEARNGKLDS